MNFAQHTGTSELLLMCGTFKVYENYRHDLASTSANVITADLLAFIKG